MNKKSYSFDMETFRNMLLICPKLHGQKFVDPPFEEEILTFIRELGYPGNIKLLSDVKVDTAQILWGLYHQEKVDYVYLLWEDLVFQIENKESRKNKYMFYLRFTKVIINHFMSQDQSIPRRNKVDWHMANDDPILTTMRFIPQHEVVQRYGTGVTPGVPDVPTYESDDEQISWKSSEEEDDDEESVSEHEDDDDDERTESDNDGDDFVPPKFLTHNEEEGEEESFDPRVRTPSHVESTDDEDDDEEFQGVNIKGEAMDDATNNEEDEGNELYMDLNVNLEGRHVEMTDDQPTNVQITQVTEDTHVIITPVIPESQQQSSSVSCSTSLVDVPVTTTAEPPLMFAITLPPPPTPLTHMQQTPVPTPIIVSSIPGIVDAYLANKMHKAVKTAVQLQSDRLRDEAQAENKDFLNKLDDNIKKIVKD
ncbi:hypothetical protein Tco_1277202 [Tanacetum coccineum]